MREAAKGLCGHRKYGVVYDTYATMKSCWDVLVFGRWFRLSFFGLLKECDLCHARFVRWPWWEPPIDRAVLPWEGPGP